MKVTRLIILIVISNYSVLSIASPIKLHRLGIGATNQLDLPFSAISFKLASSRSMAIGGAIATKGGEDGGSGWAIKIYRNVFEEPQQIFYAAFLVGNLKDKSMDRSGTQMDITLGSEFSFQGLESLGFSFEFGLSYNKLDNSSLNTIGNNLINAGIHFYL